VPNLTSDDYTFVRCLGSTTSDVSWCVPNVVIPDATLRDNPPLDPDSPKGEPLHL